MGLRENEGRNDWSSFPSLMHFVYSTKLRFPSSTGSLVSLASSTSVLLCSRGVSSGKRALLLSSNPSTLPRHLTHHPPFSFLGRFHPSQESSLINNVRFSHPNCFLVVVQRSTTVVASTRTDTSSLLPDSQLPTEIHFHWIKFLPEEDLVVVTSVCNFLRTVRSELNVPSRFLFGSLEIADLAFSLPV